MKQWLLQNLQQLKIKESVIAKYVTTATHYLPNWSDTV